MKMKQKTHDRLLWCVMGLGYLLLFAGIITRCSGCVTTQNYLPFQGRTEHRLVKRMSSTQVHRIQKGDNFYTRHNGVVYCNNKCVVQFKKRKK
jgi:hypothetical protein